MDTKTILIEVIGASIFAFVIGFLFWVLGANYGGNNPVPTFWGLPGYEGAGAFAALFGMPLGGILGAYLVRKLCTSAIAVGLSVGIVLFLSFFWSAFFSNSLKP